MRHVLLESFVWEEANRVPFLIREVSYDRDLSVDQERHTRSIRHTWAHGPNPSVLSGS